MKLQGRMLSVSQAAEWLGIGESTVRRLIRDGTLNHCRIGNRILMKMAHLEQLVEDTECNKNIE